MRKPRFFVPMLPVFVVAAGCGGTPPNPEESLGPPVTVDLKAVPSAGLSSSYQFIRLDASGEGSIPFANDAGKLLVKSAGKKARIDTNGDGAVNDQDAPAVAAGGTVPVHFRLGGKAAEYPVRITSVSNGYVLLGGQLVLEGALDEFTIRLFDINLNGVFGEQEDSVLVLGARAGDPPPAQDRSSASLLGRFIEVGDRLVHVTLLDGGRRLVCRPYLGEVAKVTIKGGAGVESCSLQLAEGGGLQHARVGDREPARLLPGTYHIRRSMVVLPLNRDKPSLFGRLGGVLRGELLPKGPSSIALSGDGAVSDGDEPVLTIRPGPQEVVLGPPFQLAFTADRWTGRRDRVEVRSARLAGAAGECYRPDVSGPGNERSTLACFVRAGDRETKLADLTFG